ncbi:MAG: hypothetical protein HY291_10670 [Planctomycetes bacterium]|nr:hypothetical protein [Planctomycetota bacterium]
MGRKASFVFTSRRPLDRFVWCNTHDSAKASSLLNELRIETVDSLGIKDDFSSFIYPEAGVIAVGAYKDSFVFCDRDMNSLDLQPFQAFAFSGHSLGVVLHSVTNYWGFTYKGPSGVSRLVSGYEATIERSEGSPLPIEEDFWAKYSADGKHWYEKGKRLDVVMGEELVFLVTSMFLGKPLHHYNPMAQEDVLELEEGEDWDGLPVELFHKVKKPWWKLWQ